MSLNLSTLEAVVNKSREVGWGGKGSRRGSVVAGAQGAVVLGDGRVRDSGLGVR